MTSKNLSPLSLIEESLYQKVKNVPFKVWHYVAALALLTVIPSVVASLLLPSDVMMWVLFGIVAVAWITSRVIGRNLSRNKGIDSVLLYRYFAVTPWVIGLVSVSIQLLIANLDDLTRLLYTAYFWISAVVLLVHILGIVIHHYKSKRMIKNIKKDELFQ
jgi:hypothetical protein